MGPGVEQNQKLIDFDQKIIQRCTYESGGEGIKSLKATFKFFVEEIDSWRGLIDLHQMDNFSRVAWTALCQAAILLVFSNFFSCVVPDDIVSRSCGLVLTLTRFLRITV